MGTKRAVADQINRMKTHCPQGHPYDEGNTYRTPGDGDRRCRECNRERSRRKRAS